LCGDGYEFGPFFAKDLQDVYLRKLGGFGFLLELFFDGGKMI